MASRTANKLFAGPDQRIDVLERLGALELGGGSPACGHQRFAGRIGDQMQMEIVFGLLHNILRGVLINRDKSEVGRRGFRLQGITHQFVHNGHCGDRFDRSHFEIEDKFQNTSWLKLSELVQLIGIMS
jgi:hypothetical protein